MEAPVQDQGPEHGCPLLLLCWPAAASPPPPTLSAVTAPHSWQSSALVEQQ